MPRPRKTETMKKRINLRVTDETFENIELVAKASGLRMYDVVRRRLEGLKIPDKKDIELLGEVGSLRQVLIKQGGLIKHLYSQNPFDPELTRSILQKQERTIESIGALLIVMKKKLGNDSENSGKP